MHFCNRGGCGSHRHDLELLEKTYACICLGGHDYGSAPLTRPSHISFMLTCSCHACFTYLVLGTRRARKQMPNKRGVSIIRSGRLGPGNMTT